MISLYRSSKNITTLVTDKLIILLVDSHYNRVMFLRILKLETVSFIMCYQFLATLTRFNIYASLSCGKDVTLLNDINVLGMLYCATNTTGFISTCLHNKMLHLHCF